MQNSKLIICADDFGQNAAISLAICQLVEAGRLNAVSCMVNGHAWRDHFSTLLRYKNQIQIGLHLNLTYGQALTHRPLHALVRLILQTYKLLPISRVWLKTEIRAQIQKFKDDTGYWPQFIDGHQHVHQLPLVREILIECVEELQIKPWFRTTYHLQNQALKQSGSWKKWLLLCLGGQTFFRLLKRHGLSGNTHFSGDYTFGRPQSYRDVFLSALRALPGEGVIMCHPGLNALDEQDAIRHSRILEFDYLTSDQFRKDMAC